MNVHAPIDQVQLWFTAQELADAAETGILLDIPRTAQGINDLARREDWQRYHALVKTEKARGRNGTLTRYHIDLLPLHVRYAYFARHMKFAVVSEVERLPQNDGNLTERARLERNARLAILRTVEQFQRTTKMNVCTADGIFADIYNGGRMEMPEWVREVVPSLSGRSLMRWRTKERETGMDTLAHDPSLARKGTGLLETANGGAVKLHIQAWVLKNPALSAKTIRGYCELEFGSEIVDANGELKPLSPPRTFQEFIKNFKETEKVAILKITNPDKYRSSGKLVGTGSYSWVTEPNQMWMIDASPADVLLKDGRHSIYMCIDVATRRCVITISKTPSAAGVALMLRKAILKWGVPKTIKTDNGSDFVALAIEQLLVSLNIKPDVSQAYTPTEKAYVERAIGTFQHEVCPQLPGYIGRNVAERKTIEERKSFAQRLGASDEVLFEVSLTAAELQLKIDDWLEYVYNCGKHGGLDDLSPDQAAQGSSAEVRRVDERALDMLLMPVAGNDGFRMMSHQGIKIDYNHYITGLVLVGTRVFVRLDPIDMGTVYVYSEDGKQFIDKAICPKLVDIDRPAFVKAQKQLHEEGMSSRLKDAKAEMREISRGPSGIDRTIELAKRKAAERETASTNVIHLPKRETQHSTPQIVAALDAITLPKTKNQPKPLNERAQLLHEAMLREAEFKHASKVVHLDPDAALAPSAKRYKWALALEKQIESGVALDDETAGNLARFQASSHYRTIRDMHNDFGLEAALTSAPR